MLKVAKAVHKSKNNHPENLLWLCSNHHTAYDDGLFGPDEESAECVVSFKKVLHRCKLLLWRTQNKISSKRLTVLRTATLSKSNWPQRRRRGRSRPSRRPPSRRWRSRRRWRPFLRVSQYFRVAAPSYDVRTFECVRCNSRERLSVAI